MRSMKSLCTAILFVYGIVDVEGFVAPPHGRTGGPALMSTSLSYSSDKSVNGGKRKKIRRKKLVKRKKRVTSISPSSAMTDIPDAAKRKVLRKASRNSSRDVDAALAAELAAYSETRKPRRVKNEEVAKATTTFGQTVFPALLTKEEEYDLAYKVQAMRAAEKKKEELTVENDLEPTETELAEACGMSSKSELRTVMSVGRDALDRYVYCNMGMVNKEAKKYAQSLNQFSRNGGVGSILTYEDLIQEGTMGLMEAIERFDPKRGFRFYTYAQYWVRNRIMLSMSNSARTIRIPISVQNTLRKAGKARKQLTLEWGRTPSDDEIAEYMGIDPEKLHFYNERSRNMLSLDNPIRNHQKSSGFSDESSTLGDFISSTAVDGFDQESYVEIVSRREDVLDVVNSLPAEERDVVLARFGVETGDPKSLAQTAKKLGISTDRVRMLEARGLNKLRHPQRNYKLRSYVDLPKTVVQKKEEKRQQLEEQEKKLFVETEEELMAQLSPEGIWAF
uniref:RNA polymerase sigma-70 domain-containing protein n=1 Tax=Grammatophora oceanica TaxID=210454 RepID=A0A7S1VJD5_9STRA|mmetsp:Transcript_48053/g.71616  ORF Transcript_48053/g.71616 Transcript_48053/m.71616 type:complete len:505 (+) Transcript_48053:340-1854(+)|eukprot:CAMPEP_0194027616 /NCGR_PEP_ID=MMETSP0009_2-20130614/1750_1 /TAXON_ID=210454 /ORGANISM="Grammatophora oceanica, Strain CCMP 410" /LENGTH=504 /DNA_ID=CAMNT_0038666757 /DNA_START=297 /DNA_END=1811 /DNA_ORIENTATION=+